MSSGPRRPGPDWPDGSKGAAAWVVRLASDQRTRADEQEFAQWLARNPAHREEYELHAALWRGVGALADDDEARQLLGLGGRTAMPATGGINRRRLIGGGMAALAAAAVAAIVVLPLPQDGGTSYRTVPGEQRRLRLPDGSMVMVNTDSVLNVAYTPAERRLHLERGQAYFEVARDLKRPFRVFVGEDEVRALGTAFDVRKDGDRAEVTLEKGRIALYRGTRGQQAGAAGGDRPLAVLSPGESATLRPASAPELAAADLRKTRAWRYGRIILDSAPLGESVAELNRYGGKEIILADPALEQLRISGVFHTGRPEAFVEGVTAALPVKLASNQADKLVLEPR